MNNISQQSSNKTSHLPLTFCTSNVNKFQEAQDLLAKYNISLVHKEISLPEIQDNAISNIALFSARIALQTHPHPLIVEDTGFFIHELNDFPGPYAAFIEKTIGNPGIHRLMTNVTQRSAEFRTAIAFIQPGFLGHVVEGKVNGKISDTIRHGTFGEGWGYDPIFIPDGYNQTYAEMGRAQKNCCSHRYNAFKLFANWYQTQFLKSEKVSISGISNSSISNISGILGGIITSPSSVVITDSSSAINGTVALALTAESKK